MGAFSSRPNICPYCTVSIKLPDDDDTNNSLSQQSDESIFCCSRCNGALKLKSTKPIQFELHAQPIQYLHIYPFDDNALNEEFKISNDNNELEEKKNDTEEQEEELDDEMLRAIQMSMQQDHDTILINEYLKPFFNKNKNLYIKNGNRLIINNIEFKIFGCYPPYGYVNNNTNFILNNSKGKLMKLKTRPIHRIHILATKPSIQTYCKNIKINCEKVTKELFTTHIKTYLQDNDEKLYIQQDKTDRAKNRYLMEGEKFVWRDIEFRVMKCEPCDGYVDLKLTQIFCNGESISDIKSISIRPVSDALPVNHREFTSLEIQNYYLTKYFYGLYKFIDYSNDNDIIRINDIEFMLFECVPPTGIITCSTNINNSLPIKHYEMQQIQAHKDELIAREIQQNEYRNARNNLHRMSSLFSHSNIINNNNNNNNNNNDPFFQFIRLLEQFNAMRMEEKENDENRGINQRLINTLPTFTYTNQTKGNSNENKSCRICLEDYNIDDELRALPCFHSFHTNCVDHWLQINEKCPICKTSVKENS